MKKMKERIEAKKEARMEELREELRQEKETKKETEEMKNEENKINESPIEDNEAKEAKIEETENKEAETEASENEEKEEMVENGVHNYSAEESYVWPTDPKVRKKLEWFRDQKLGLMMHWGAYSQLGIVESWALSDADACWSRHCIDWEVTGEEFKKQYFDLNKTFNPIRFEPENGPISQRQPEPIFAVYDKHHDGFCLCVVPYGVGNTAFDDERFVFADDSLLSVQQHFGFSLRDDEQVVGSVGVGRDGAAAVRGEIGDGAVYDLAAGSEQIFGQEIYVFGWCDESIFFIHIGIFLKLSGVFCPLFVEASYRLLRRIEYLRFAQ